MDGSCNIRGRHEKYIQNFGRKNLQGRDNSKDVGVDGKTLEWILVK
jgi:hypothetical protein